jgi:hypothetical protein
VIRVQMTTPVNTKRWNPVDQKQSQYEDQTADTLHDGLGVQYTAYYEVKYESITGVDRIMPGSPMCVYDLYDEEPQQCGYSHKTEGMTKDWYFCTSKYRRLKCKEKKAGKYGVEK